MPPLSTHQILLTGTPTKVGTTRARGCSIALSGCAPRSFRVLNKDAKDKVQIAQSNELDDRRLKIKATGLDARPLVLAQARMAAALQRNESSTSADVTNKKIVSTPSSKFVSCQVVDPQPLLVLQSASTPHGSLVLLDGEMTTIRLQVLNAGTLPVDWIRLSFMDNLSEKMKKELNEGELNPSQAFLAEDKLLHSPVLSYSLSPRHAKHQISPGETRELQVNVRARVGCTHLSIFADYAYVDGPGRGGLQTDEARDWYHRRLSVPLAITVLPVVELGKLEIKTLRPYEAVRTLADGLKALERTGGGLPDGLADAKLFERLLQGRPDKECLVSFPMVNAHRNNVEVVVSLKDEAYHSKLRVRRSLPQNARAQIVFPFPRLDISTEELDRPIPSLSPRQFVVPKSKSSPAEQAVARARFWLAQEVVAKLSGWRERAPGVRSDGIGGANEHASLEGTSTNARSSSARWIDRSTGRKGYIDLSSLMVADDHLQCLRRDPLSLSLHISTFAGGDAVQENGLVGSEEANGRLTPENDANEGLQRTNGTLDNGARSASKVPFKVIVDERPEA
ncbi:PROTEIN BRUNELLESCHI [Ceraceosorus bombacis]|uniref:PROTEIN BRUNELLESCHI n=1 Tax=Ceraceosorus bombacis TaxID=401625 RepID=A0A0P1BJD5_9BASI|nr:PROTEIN BRUNELLESCHI [Ceraceosorus bombacis]